MSSSGGENANSQVPNVRQNGNEGIRKPALTKDEIYAYALAKLGFPIMEVEADRSQLEIFLQQTLDTLNEFLPLEKYDVLDTVSSAINQYDMRVMKKPFGRGIVGCQIATRSQFFSPISGVFALGIPHPITPLAPDQYDLALRYIDMARRVYSSAFDWEWEEPILWLYSPSGYGGPFVVAYKYLTSASKPEDVPDVLHRWVKEFFYNLVRQAVGEARSKYSSLPGPNGQQLNGQAMVDKAEAAIKELEQELRLRSRALVTPLGPGRGATG